MKYKFALMVAALLAISTSGNSQKQGWTDLSKGNIADSWHTYGNDGVTNAWTEVDGTFHLEGETPENKTTRKGGDLVTNQAYENFELELEWKISKGGNSGIIFLVQDNPRKYGATYLTGLEMQVLDNIEAHDNKLETHLAGSLYDLAGTAKNLPTQTRRSLEQSKGTIVQRAICNFSSTM